MARRAKRLNPIYTKAAIRSLNEIWTWNAKERGEAHADKYVAFLKAKAEKLADDRTAARPIDGREDLQYAILRWRGAKGHAHLAVFGINGDDLILADFHHTAQDWQSGYAPESE
jgi:plasmid stabilization system protein ParE